MRCKPVTDGGHTHACDGQARVSLARATYSRTEIVILDDTLSAVDAHVGKAILEGCLLDGPLADRTRIMVTHTMQVVPRSDYVYLVEDGKVTERGTYSVRIRSEGIFSRQAVIHHIFAQELAGKGGAFNALIASLSEKQCEPSLPKARSDALAADVDMPSDDSENVGLMQDEDRNHRAVATEVYIKYLKAAGGLRWAPLIFSLLLISEATNGKHRSAFSAGRILHILFN